MNKTGSMSPLLIYYIIGAVLLAFNLTILDSIIVGVIGFLLYLGSIILFVTYNFKKYTDSNVFISSLITFSLFILVNTILYYIHGTTKLIALLLVFSPIVFFILPNKAQINFKLKLKNKITFNIKHLSAIFIFLALELLLIATLIINRSTELMPSPWQAVESWFFIVYAIATALLFFLVYTRNSTKERILLSSLHLLSTFVITAILYPLGYGFDAFVHRATESWILQNGSILPKQPYYIGQYSLVVWLSHLTKIPIFYIDVYLVPLLASFTLPAGIIYSLKRGLNLSSKYASYGVWLIPFVPFLSLHLTTPHNLVLLLSILIVFLSLPYLQDKFNGIVLILLSVSALCIHPLVGGPIFIFTLSSIVLKKYSKNKKMFISIALLSFLALSLSLSAMFLLNNLKNGLPLPQFTNPISSIDKFLELFARPYWYAKNTPLIYELLYLWQRLIVPITVVLGVVGFCLYQKKSKNHSLLIFPISTLGFFVSAWLLRSWLVSPDVVSYEQGDFPLRLVKASILFLLPFAVYFIYLIIKKIENQKKKKIFLATITIFSSVILMISLYLSYPQRNIKARFPGLNVTMTDFEAVEWIHDRHEQYDYIVLSNQLVSAAALTNYSFAKYFQTPNGEIFYYSVPTGGLLYKQYGKMLYEGQKREYMTEAMNIAEVDKAYFVINSYWANADQIIEGAKRSANAWLIMNGGKIWIFEYNR